MPRETTEERKSFFGMPKMLLTMDMFGAPLPTFNVRGEESVRTYTGGFVSIIIIYVAFLFASLKLQHLMSKHNPSVNIFKEEDAFDADDVWSGDGQDFFMAFAVADFVTGELKNDPRFVKYNAEYIHRVDGNNTLSQVPIHPCTDEEYARFYEPTKTYAAKVERIKKLDGWMCLDWDTVQLAGIESMENFRNMDVILNPCNYKMTLSGASEDRIPEDCNWDKQKLIDYMGPSEMLVYYNTGRFQLDEFGNERIKKMSVIQPTQFDEARSTFINTLITSNVLGDETSLIQYGVQDEEEFTTVQFELPRPSSWAYWPTKEKPNNRYKVISAYVTLTMDQNMIERQTYSLLEWLGDVGGLFDMLSLIGGSLVAPLTAFALKSELLTQTFRFTESLTYAEKRAKKRKKVNNANQVPPISELEGDEKLAAHMEWDFSHASRIKARNFLVTTFGCNRRSKFKRMLAKAESSISKELDIVKFLQRQRLTSYTAIATLNGRQQYIADKMATMVIRESTDFDDSTEDDFELAQENVFDTTDHGKKIFYSHNEVDRRLLRTYQAKRWKDDYKRHKGKFGPYKELEAELKNGVPRPQGSGERDGQEFNDDLEASGRQLVNPTQNGVQRSRISATPANQASMMPKIAYIAKKPGRKSETRPHKKRNFNSTNRSDYYREHLSDSNSDEDSSSSRRRNQKRSEQQLNERRGKSESRNLEDGEQLRETRKTSHRRRDRSAVEDDPKSQGRRASKSRK